jgi:hypothetical protein
LKIALCVFGFSFVSFLAVCVYEQKSTIVYFLVTITLKISDVCANKVNEQNDIYIFLFYLNGFALNCRIEGKMRIEFDRFSQLYRNVVH